MYLYYCQFRRHWMMCNLQANSTCQHLARLLAWLKNEPLPVTSQKSLHTAFEAIGLHLDNVKCWNLRGLKTELLLKLHQKTCFALHLRYVHWNLTYCLLTPFVKYTVFPDETRQLTRWDIIKKWEKKCNPGFETNVST